MYKIYSDDYLLYDDTIENLKIFSPKLTLELNKQGSFTFSIYTGHPYYQMIKKLKSIITVYQDGFLIFRGRPINIESGFYNQKTIECEGELAFLIDSIQQPYTFSGSITEYLTMLLESHNAQVDTAHQFTLGNVTVTDDNDYIVRSNIDHVTVWDEINKKLIGNLGGYLWVRHVDGVNYLDYLEDFTLLSSQKIEFSKNLLDLKQHEKGEDIATVLIPLGAKLKDENGNETDERLTIESVNDGKKYIEESEAISKYGRITKVQVWDDVTIAQNLKTKGNAFLAGLTNPDGTIELTAADLATVNTDFTSIHLGTYVPVISKPHGINQNFLVNKLTIELLNPAANKLTLGGVIESFSGKTAAAIGNIKDGKDGQNGQDGKDAAIQSTTEPSDTSYMWLDISVEPPLLKRYNSTTGVWEAINDTSSLNTTIYELEQHVYTEIANTEESIISTVAEQYYLKTDAEKLASEMSTQITQTAEDMIIQFNKFNADLEGLANNTDTEFEQIRKYIRFVDGKILLGESGNQLELEISNNRISFMQNKAEVAYFSDNKLYVVDGEFTNSLRLGNFAYLPRSNGNLSFKKI